MKNTRVYLCKYCGNLIQMINNVGEAFTCCNSLMSAQDPIAKKMSPTDYKYIRNESIEFILDTTSDQKIFLFLKTNLKMIKKIIEPNKKDKIIFNLFGGEIPQTLLFYKDTNNFFDYEIINDAVDENNIVAGWFHQKSVFDLACARKIADELKIDFSKVNYTIDDLLFGMTIELEHGYVYNITNVSNDNALITAKIALAHLNENNFYYNKKIGLTAWKSAINNIKQDPDSKKIEIK